MATQTYVDSVTLSSATEWNRWDTAAYCYLTGVAGTNTITATGPANMTLAAPQHPVVLVPANTNTGATTLNITPSGGSALTAKNVFVNGIACVGGELRQSVPYLCVYDGTQYQVLGAIEGRGTWSPAQGSGLTLVGGFSSSGTYTKIGRQVFVTGKVIGATSVAVSAVGDITSNLPFTVSGNALGGAVNNASDTFAGILMADATTRVIAITAIAATPNITFSGTYNV